MLAWLAFACRPPTPVDTDTDTDLPRDTGPVDCDALPTGPLPIVEVPGARANEDLVFHEGALYGFDADTNFGRVERGGEWELIRPATGFRAGLRALPDGDLVAASYETGTVYRLDPDTGATTPLVSGMAYPNGIEIGPDGKVYFTEWGGGRVLRVDPTTLALDVLAEGLENPNGLVFDVAGTTLWLAENDATNRVSRMSVDPGTGAVGPVELAMPTGAAGIDGLAVDACDNLYVLSWDTELVRRWDGSGFVTLVDRGNTGFGLGNVAWGDPAGGWDPHHGFLVQFGSGRVYEVALGVGAK
ncbi:MAG: SMP-30/gluconolactonase/LRE family protein [Alphaproteobacteria bacterium]|nr:SMP-30/gluconolactonase/LRE family protein [Alphaproteobacteria bacterium]